MGDGKRSGNPAAPGVADRNHGYRYSHLLSSLVFLLLFSLDAKCSLDCSSYRCLS